MTRPIFNLIEEIMNELEHGYGITELESYGGKTAQEIADKLETKYEVKSISINQKVED